VVDPETGCRMSAGVATSPGHDGSVRALGWRQV